MSTRVVWSEMTAAEQGTLTTNLMRETQMNFANKNLSLPIGWHKELLELAKRKTWYRHKDGTVRINK